MSEPVKLVILPKTCQYATFTGVPWNHGRNNCTRVECRCPESQIAAKQGVFPPHLKDLPCTETRRAHDENFKLIPDADFFFVRSRQCNSKCPYFKEK